MKVLDLFFKIVFTVFVLAGVIGMFFFSETKAQFVGMFIITIVAAAAVFVLIKLNEKS
jgi:hypothetical protein